MSRVIKTTVYQFEELSEAAKEKARDWWRRHVFEDSSDWDFVFEDAIRMAKLLGIEVASRTAHGVKGKTWEEPCIFFSGFSSQGDGASFDGTYSYAKGAVAAIQSETGFGFKCSDGTVATGDVELIRIARGLQAVQKRYFYKLVASCKVRGHYSHSGCMAVDVEHCEDQYRDIGDAEVEITQLLRDFADWIYKQLEAEYEYQNSDAAVDDSIIANEYEFTEDGERV